MLKTRRGLMGESQRQLTWFIGVLSADVETPKIAHEPYKRHDPTKKSRRLITTTVSFTPKCVALCLGSRKRIVIRRNGHLDCGARTLNRRHHVVANLAFLGTQTRYLCSTEFGSHQQ